MGTTSWLFRGERDVNLHLYNDEEESQIRRGGGVRIQIVFDRSTLAESSSIKGPGFLTGGKKFTIASNKQTCGKEEKEKLF